MAAGVRNVIIRSTAWDSPPTAIIVQVTAAASTAQSAVKPAVSRPEMRKLILNMWCSPIFVRNANGPARNGLRYDGKLLMECSGVAARKVALIDSAACYCSNFEPLLLIYRASSPDRVAFAQSVGASIPLLLHDPSCRSRSSRDTGVRVAGPNLD